MTTPPSVLAAAIIAVTAPCATAFAQSTARWIDFTPYTNFGIYVPVKINGHEAMALVYGGPSNIDKSFAASIGLEARPDADGAVSGLAVQIGDVTLQNVSAKTDDLRAQAYDAKILEAPVLFRLGEEVFNRLVVDIDFARHRIAFRDPKSVTKPSGAIEVPLIALDSARVVPLSVDGAAPAQFELELGNVIGPLMVTPAYAETHKLLEGHPTSLRLSGPFKETVVSLEHLRFAGVDFPDAPIALIPDSNLPPAPITGGVGLPLLAKFRLIIDYSHNRLYAIPNAEATKTAIPKDRIGLVLDKKDTSGFSVAFVAPHSPAETAGFKKGDKIALIDGRPFHAWPTRAIIAFQMADAGTTHTFAMPDGTTRHIKAADFF
jgi:hypothetical protein